MESVARWQKLGAELDEQGIPRRFRSLDEEHDSVRNGAAIVDLSHRTRLTLTGRDRKKLLHNLCTQQVVEMPDGAGGEAFLLDAKGKILDFVRLFSLADTLLLDAEPGRAEFLRNHLDRYVIREDVQFANDGANTRLFHILGATAGEYCQTLVENGTLPESHFGIARLQWKGDGAGAGEEATMTVRRVDRSCWPGWDWLVPNPLVDSFLDRVLAKAGVEPIGSEVMEILRIEAGLPVYDRDFNTTNLAQEIARDATAISFTKGCYIGQETVARIDAMGHVNKLLVGVRSELGTAQRVAIPAELRIDDKVIGTLTSFVESPWLEGSVGLAIVRRACAQPGTEFLIGPAELSLRGRVSLLPFTARTP